MPTIEPFADVDVTAHADWIRSVPIAEWRHFADPAYRNWSERFVPITTRLMTDYFDAWRMSGMGLFVLDPGQMHPLHTDEQPSDWVTRVHVPIITNPRAIAITDAGMMHMEAGKAYRFNTRESHGVANHGLTPRVHLVFDVRKA